MSKDSMEIGRYKVLDELGSGAYSTVYRVQDTVLRREMALKVMHPALLSEPTFVERFQQEARVVASLRHRHIVIVYDYGEYDDRLCLVMDLLHGGSLNDLLAAGPLPWERALEITQQVAEALDYAHRRDLVHRDVKPHNILLDEDGRAVLADFGVVRALQSGTVARTLSGGVVGTPAYIPVEIWDGEPPSPRTDIYALACVVYEMITGERLFQGSSLSNTIRRHLRPPQFPDEWPEGVPAGIEKVLVKALAQYPSRRYQSAGAFAQALAALPVEPPVVTPGEIRPAKPREAAAARAAEGDVTSAGGLLRWALPVAALLGMTSLAIIVLVVAGIILFGRDDGDVTPAVTAEVSEEPTPTVEEASGDGVESQESSGPAPGSTFTLAGYCVANPGNCVGRGDADAPVTVVEVVDYGCSHCADFHRDTAPLLEEQYVDDGTVMWIVLPYALQEATRPAAEAVLCARDQGAFWAYHAALFELQDDGQSSLSRTKIGVPASLPAGMPALHLDGNWELLSLSVRTATAWHHEALFQSQDPGGSSGQEALIELADTLALDVDDFAGCLGSGEYADAVQNNVDAARRVGVSGVPTFFINGEVVAGNQPLSVFQERIEDAD